MNETSVTWYRMNPDEDEILFADELAEGMWILPEHARRTASGDEDLLLRAQRFRRIIRIRPGAAAAGDTPAQVVLVCEWVDKYRETWSGAVTITFLVKKEPAEDGGGMITKACRSRAGASPGPGAPSRHSPPPTPR